MQYYFLRERVPIHTHRIPFTDRTVTLKQLFFYTICLYIIILEMYRFRIERYSSFEDSRTALHYLQHDNSHATAPIPHPQSTSIRITVCNMIVIIITRGGQNTDDLFRFTLPVHNNLSVAKICAL